MRKKVILFIVEGITDRESLELSLQTLLEKDNSVVFEVVQGDITANAGVRGNNIRRKLTDIINSGGRRKFLKRDYREIVHLIDTDGAFVSEDYIIEDERFKDFHYTQEMIYNQSKERVWIRNQKKQASINILLSTQKVYGNVPYRMFYFSCNLEHVLHNEISVRDRNKMEYAHRFQDKYADDEQAFVDFICESDFSVKMDYYDSWDFIMRENNSLKRYTNFNLFLEDVLSEYREEESQGD